MLKHITTKFKNSLYGFNNKFWFTEERISDLKIGHFKFWNLRCRKKNRTKKNEQSQRDL